MFIGAICHVTAAGQKYHFETCITVLQTVGKSVLLCVSVCCSSYTTAVMAALPVTSKVGKVIDNIIKSPEDKRLYRGLQLKNGMKLLLISDATADKSAAALDVHIGM